MSRIPGWTNVSSLALRFVLFAGVAVCAQLAGPAWAGVIYVKADATGPKTGHSWADAYTDLQAALAAAVWYDEIWVAQGIYKPTTGTDRAVSFVLKSGVGLYGGFAGAETERGQRNWEANATILSGDIGAAGDATDNSYHVVVGAHLAVLDGFTITGGNNSSGSNGGGMYNADCSPTVSNCTFSGNTAGYGGGMCNYGSPTVTNCTFSGNTATYGGGMYNGGGSPTVTNCTFSGNTVIGGGGGMANADGSPTVTNCTFSDNTAGVGGGMFNWISSSPTVANCTFSGNTATGTNASGGGMANAGGSPTVTNCTFSGNTAGGSDGGDGGGMYNDNGAPTVTNCIFWDNSAPSGAEIYKESGTPTFRHCDIRGSGGSGALWNPALGKDGSGNIGTDPRFVAPATPAGPEGLWRTGDDGLRLRSDSPCIGAADPAVAPGTDILGLRRKIAPDIGAYEFPSIESCTLTYNGLTTVIVILFILLAAAAVAFLYQQRRVRLHRGSLRIGTGDLPGPAAFPRSPAPAPGSPSVAAISPSPTGPSTPPKPPIVAPPSLATPVAPPGDPGSPPLPAESGKEFRAGVVTRNTVGLWVVLVVAWALVAGILELEKSQANAFLLGYWQVFAALSLSCIGCVASAWISKPPRPPHFLHEFTPSRGYAGFWKRFAAFFIDTLVLIVPGLMLQGIIGALFAPPSDDEVSALRSLLWAYCMTQLAVIAMWWLYYSLMESSAWQATLGKKALGIVVVDSNGNRLTWGRATGRHFGKIISAFPMGIGLIMATFTQRKQALHDMMAGTLVVNK